jgi:Senescence-associated protein
LDDDDDDDDYQIHVCSNNNGYHLRLYSSSSLVQNAAIIVLHDEEDVNQPEADDSEKWLIDDDTADSADAAARTKELNESPSMISCHPHPSSTSSSSSSSSREFHHCLNLFDSFASLGVVPRQDCNDNDSNRNNINIDVLQALVCLAMVAQLESGGNSSSRLLYDEDSCSSTTTSTITTCCVSSSSRSLDSRVSRQHALMIHQGDTSTALLEAIPTSGRVRDMVARMENSSHLSSIVSLQAETKSSNSLRSGSRDNSNNAIRVLLPPPPPPPTKEMDQEVAAAQEETFDNAIDTVGEYLAAGGSTTIPHRKQVLGQLLRIGLWSRDEIRSNLTDHDERLLAQMELIFWSNDLNELGASAVMGNAIVDSCWFWQLRAVTQHAMRRQEQPQQQRQQQQAKRRLLAIQNDSHQLVTSIAEVAGLLEETVLETTMHVCRGIDETGSWFMQQQQQQQQEQEQQQSQGLDEQIKSPSEAENPSNKQLSPSRFCWYNDSNDRCEEVQQKENDDCSNWQTPTKSTPAQRNTRFSLLEDRKNQIVYETYSDAALRATTAAHSAVSRALTATKDASRLGITKAAQACEKQGLGEKLVADADHRTVLAAVANIGLASLGAVAVVGDACIESSSRVVRTAGAVTANVVEHKYGPSAGKVVRDGGAVALNVWKTLALVKFVAPHVLTKILAKETGKQHLRRKQKEADCTVKSSKDYDPPNTVLAQPARDEIARNHSIRDCDSRAKKPISFQFDCPAARRRYPNSERVIAAKKEICEWISDCPCPSTLL